MNARALTEAERGTLAEIDLASLLADIDAVVSVRSLDGAESPAQEVMAHLMAARGLHVHKWAIDLEALRRHPAYSSEVERREAVGLVGEIGGSGGGRDLIFNAHTDVVPPGDEGLWVHDPWRATVDAGYVYGRGALDDKGGLCCALQAAHAIAAAGIRLRGRLLVESAIGEEDGGAGTLATILAGYSADGAIVVEPTCLAVVPAQAGALNFRITVPGASAHGCVRDEGVSAVEQFRTVHDALLALEQGRNRRVKAADDAADRPLFSPYSLPIPLSIGVVRAGDWPSTVPERLVCEGRYGVAIGEDPAAARDELERAVDAAAADDPWLRDHPPLVEWWGGRFDPASTPLDDPVVTTVRRAFRAVNGAEPTVEGVTYGADMRLLVNEGGIPAVLFGPGDVRRSHRPDEGVPVEELLAATRTLVVAALRFCGHEEETPV